MSFPALSLNPTTIDAKKTFNTISIVYDGGYKQTRERNTRDLMSFTVYYPSLATEDKDAILAHINEVRGSTFFDWTNVDDKTTYTVRYSEYPTIKADAKMPNRYSITLKMEEV